MKFDIGMTVDTPLGRGKITQLRSADYFVQIGPEGFARGGGEWFAETELEYVTKMPPLGEGFFPDTLDLEPEDYQGL